VQQLQVAQDRHPLTQVLDYIGYKEVPEFHLLYDRDPRQNVASFHVIPDCRKSRIDHPAERTSVHNLQVTSRT